MTQTEDFVFLLVEDFTHIAFSCAIEPLRIANLVAGAELYRWRLASENGRTATCSNRTVTLVDGGFAPLGRDERLFLISGANVERHTSPALLTFLRRERARGTRIGAICSASYILARAGFLDGERAAIHWGYHDLFAELFPAVTLVPNVFVADGRFVTASGGAAAADLVLHLIARAHGEEFAIAVADQMVYNSVREGTAAQRISLQSRHGIRNGHLIAAVRIMQRDIETPRAPCEIAAELGISTRQLERLFVKYLNTSPKRYAVDMRLNRARNLIVQSERSITEIAVACGFNSTSHFSRLFRSRFGISPVMQRAILA